MTAELNEANKKDEDDDIILHEYHSDNELDKNDARYICTCIFVCVLS